VVGFTSDSEAAIREIVMLFQI